MEDGSYSQNIGTVTANSLYEQKAENIRITNLSRALKKKYNMNYTSNEVWDDTQKSRSLYVRHNNDHKRFLKQGNIPLYLRQSAMILIFPVNLQSGFNDISR